MSEHLDIATIDPSGDIRTVAADAGAFADAGFDRRAALRRSAAAGGGLLLGAGLFQTMLSPAEAAISKTRKSKTNDIAILNYALTLEYLEAAFYAQAVANIKFANANLAYFATTTGKHEADHVTTLKSVLKKKAVKAPEVMFGAAVTDEKTFAATAQVLEDTGVAAYAGQVTHVYQAAVLEAAAAIHSVEARHAAWIRFLNGGGVPGADPKSAPAFTSFDVARSEKSTLKAVKATGFVPGL
ncbi:MAG: ferritin-like domain-containing protein [Solirubrobacteraceae bacterium]|nr:ferritin-like domain-containing protein [Solirubrobacteraceae bacterium]